MSRLRSDAQDAGLRSSWRRSRVCAQARMTRLPTLGPRGEGWVAIQFVLFALIAVAGGALGGQPGGAAQVVGVVAIALGGAVAAWAGLALQRGRALTAVPHPPDGAELVDVGPYALIRHPIYSGIVLAAVGWSVARGSGAALAASVVLLVFFDLKRRREEAWLLERLAGYEAYSARTRALVPFLY